MKRLGQGLSERCFTNSRHIFDQQMAARQQGDQRQLNNVFLAVDSAGNGTLQLRDHVRCGGRHRLKTLSLPVTNR